MSDTIEEYTLGFMFDEKFEQVALIRKNRPQWQAGKLNGLGGKIESGEYPLHCMIREFKEESGFVTGEDQWSYFCQLVKTGKFAMYCYATVGDVWKLQTMESEKVEIIPVSTLYPGRKDVIENLWWLVGLAIDNLLDGRPKFVRVNYDWNKN